MTATLPPGPRMPMPLQTVGWITRPFPMLERCRARYGDAFTLRIAHEGIWVMLSDPEAIKQVFTGDPRLLHAGAANKILEPILGPNSVLLLDEDAHLRQRKLLLPPFHGARMQRYGELMREVAEAEIASWPAGEPLALAPRMQALTLEIILRAVFGVRDAGRLRDLRRALRTMLEVTTDPVATAAVMVVGAGRITRLPRARRLLATVDALVYREIAERRAAPDLEEREDILSLLLQARHEDGSPMSDREVRDELVTLLVAGHETTATALSWALERLTRHPGKLERLRAEAQAGETAYNEAVVQETLRLRPVIAIVLRRLVERMEIGGFDLPAGVTVAPCIYLVHRREDVYPDPRAFRPERFLERPPGTYTWIPFGGGVRRCLGAAFAQFEMQVVLDAVVRAIEVRPARPEGERIQRRAITHAPGRRAEVVVQARERAPVEASA